MRLLGAVLAGGAARRFGGDKALARLDGVALIDRVLAALAPQVAEIVVCGRDYPPWTSLADRPVPGLGPLGGLCAALAHAAANGHDAVLCVPCDAPGLPDDLAIRLGGGPSVALGQRIVGLWPVGLAPTLRDHLATCRERSLRRWIAIAGASERDCGTIANINRPGDLVSRRSG